VPYLGFPGQVTSPIAALYSHNWSCCLLGRCANSTKLQVLDQSIRIVQASIDVLTELGYLSSCTMMMTLLQCIKSARWPDDGPLALLPGVDTDKERERAKEGRSHPRALAEIHDVGKPALAKVLAILGVTRELQPQVDRVVNTLPNLRINLMSINALGLTVGVTRLNSAVQPEYRIYAPKYPKPQSEGFFLLVADPAKDEVLALKRINWPPVEKIRGSGNKPTCRSAVMLSPESVARRVDVLVVSDSYVGMVWSVKGVELPVCTFSWASYPNMDCTVSPADMSREQAGPVTHSLPLKRVS